MRMTVVELENKYRYEAIYPFGEPNVADKISEECIHLIYFAIEKNKVGSSIDGAGCVVDFLHSAEQDVGI